MNAILFDLRLIMSKGMSYVTVQTICKSWKIMFPLSRVMITVVFLKVYIVPIHDRASFIDITCKHHYDPAT